MSLTPGVTSPRSISAANGTRGASRAVTKGASAGASSGFDRGDALFRGFGITRVALAADESAAELLGHRAGGAGAAERVEHQVVEPRADDSSTRASSASGFCVGCSFLPSRPFSRSSPVHRASVQSERTWMSSLPALSVS